ncbi:hypothetical protein EQM14_09380 [Caproiciproducens sp. NJN-50]|uniref:class I adenylate-forming enzyme family protein n=1 Tax=Acutalibacteraceae TaxID=3082771 RepID=UPI000FFE2E7F|nr:MULTISPECIES: class I adenylate-forming enzyme family protein [Acutalibacteraceae]QAT49963.1 hypothetical protein EQM14_09380 [Caproiciproducens sp. NJN-50]
MELMCVTISELTKRNAELYPCDIAYIFDERKYTWEEVEGITDWLAVDMLNKGIRKGTHVGLWAVNSVQLVMHLFAAQKIGAIPSVFNYSYKALEMQSVLSYADIEYLYIGEEKSGMDYWKTLEEIRETLPCLKAAFDMLESMGKADAIRRSQGLVTGETAALLTEKKAQVTTDDTCCLMFTSGTTRRPKGVLLSYFSVLNDANELVRLLRWKHGEDIFLAAMPMFHCSGLTCGLMLALCAGIPMIIHRIFNAERAMQDIEKYKVTAFNVVPSMLMLMVQNRSFGKYDISSYRSGTSAGSGFSPEDYRKIIRKIGVRHLQMGYGQTETSPLVTFSLYDDGVALKSETIGKEIPNMEVRIWNLQDGRLAETDEHGEIQVKGFAVMKGYYKLEEESRKAFTPDGWLRTGDLGFRDADGYFHFVARMGDMIIRGGENIAPSEIECVIGHYSGDLAGVKVVGVPVNDVVQEEIVAFVVMKKPMTADPEDIRRFVKSRLANYKAPKYVFQIDSFPMTGSGKADLSALKRLGAEKIEVLQKRAICKT